MDQSERDSGGGGDLGLWRRRKSQSHAEVLVGLPGWLVMGCGGRLFFGEGGR